MAPHPSPSVSAAADDSPTSDSSAAAFSSSDMLNCHRIPLLVPLCKEPSGSAVAQSTVVRQLLKSQTDTSATATVPRLTVVESNLNFRPVIGILTHPGDGASGRLNDAGYLSYIAASYVKFVESAGARVIPLIYNEPWEKLSLVNGVIFTGGRGKRGLYTEVVESIFKEILRKNDAGDHFPLLPICLGFDS